MALNPDSTCMGMQDTDTSTMNNRQNHIRLPELDAADDEGVAAANQPQTMTTGYLRELPGVLTSMGWALR